jgi:8-hydroxy-5-deazaflavin:NADPH oxidoreductase
MVGDSGKAKKTSIEFLDQIGYDAVGAGPLSEGWRFERRRPVYCVPLNTSMLTQMLVATTYDAIMPEWHWRYQRGIHA